VLLGKGLKACTLCLNPWNSVSIAVCLSVFPFQEKFAAEDAMCEMGTIGPYYQRSCLHVQP